MAIETGDLIDKFGTTDYLNAGGATSTASSVADGAFSIEEDVVEWTNDDDATEAGVTLEFEVSTTPTTTGGINLYYSYRDIGESGTANEFNPSTVIKSHYAGTFNTTTTMTANAERPHGLKISLANLEASQVYFFKIENNCGQTISAGWTLRITPMTVGRKT